MHHTDIWAETISGRAFSLIDPDPKSILITDIADSLAKQCRFNGHIPRFYSVAQHCCIVADLLPARLGLYGLLHDAHEAYIGDIIRPVKMALRHMSHHRPLQRMEENIDAAIHESCELPWPLSDADADLIHRADMIALATERRDICNTSPHCWDGLPEPADFMITPAPWPKAAEMYLKKFISLAWDTAPSALAAQNLDPIGFKEAAL